MRTFAIGMLLFTFAASALAKDESVEQLKARLESARPEDRSGICIDIARLQVSTADKLYREDKAEQARAALDDVTTYSGQARDAAVAANKNLKKVEIAVRKMSEKLRDVKRTVTVEEQPPIDRAVQSLEDIRTSLLKEMFGKEKK